MKLAAVLCTHDVVSGALAIFSGSFEERAAKARRMGFHGVELMIRDPAALDAASIGATLRSHQLEVVQVITGEIYGQDRLCLVTPIHDTYVRALERFRSVVNFAAPFGAYVNIGRFRGRLDWIKPPDVGYQMALERIGEVARFAAARGVKLTLEPINRYEVDFIMSTQDGLGFLRELGEPNVGLMLDLFHMNIEDSSIEKSLQEAWGAGVLWHVHIADSNRWHPGSGHIDFRHIIDCLHRMGYEGYLSAEILPMPDPDTAARETASYIGPML